jgi:hypothetical protein
MSQNDMSEIMNVVNLYPVAVDTQQWALFGQVFIQTVRADFGGPAVWNDLASLKAAFEAIHAPFDSTQHTTTNHQVRVDGSQASCLSYVHGRFVRSVPVGGNMFESTGWYDDELLHTADGWRISKRVCRMQWWGGNPAVLETMPGIKVEHVLNSLHAEASAHRIAHVSKLLEPVIRSS